MPCPSAAAGCGIVNAADTRMAKAKAAAIAAPSRATQVGDLKRDIFAKMSPAPP